MYLKNDDKNPTKDEIIVDLIKDQLEEKMQASSMDINVSCKDGIVQLSGFVDVLKEKKYAQDIVLYIKGVKAIENNLTISMDGNFNDKHIEKELSDNLNSNKYRDRISNVGTKVNDGTASLIGTVNTLKDCHIALDIASKTRGLKNVVNNISIVSPKRVDDSSITNNIIQQFSLNKIDNIDCNVDNGTVTLKGVVESRKDVELAKDIAMDIKGVRKLKTKLKLK
ncbi:MAG: BON domain-containing protein [Firmicutes bacterium]|nr:BON domain-containing protein [Bacillota bacterium]